MHIITMLLLLSVLILVHELGHFGVARLFNITVERFGFGLPFGPTLAKFNWGKTKVYIHSFLLGGYVSFPDDDPDSEVPLDDEGRILNRPIWQRFWVISAGVIANALIAYILVLLVASLSGGIPSNKYDISIKALHEDKNMPAHSIPIEPGDKILKTNGIKIDNPSKFIAIAQLSKKHDDLVADIIIKEKIDQLKKLNPSLANLKIDEPIKEGAKIKLPKSQLEPIYNISKKDLFKLNEIKKSDVTLNGYQKSIRDKIENKKTFTVKENTTIFDIAIAHSDTAHPLNITVERNDKEIILPYVAPNKDGVIGVNLEVDEIITETKTLKDIFVKSWDYLQVNTVFMVDGLVKVFTGQIPLDDLHGIVAITKVGSDIIEHKGIWDGILLTALISMDLAIINLLPIPALDGGHLFFLLIEKIRGRQIEQDTQEKIAQFGFLFLIGLMIFVIFNDIFALVTNKI